MSTPGFVAFLEEAYKTHARVSALSDFCTFADDLTASAFEPRMIPSCDLLLQDGGMVGAGVEPLARQAVAVARDAFWRQTYEDTTISQDFMERFGCYCVIGPDAPWTSETFAAYVVYMPAGLDYPWHEHPAEEMYFILAGSAEFQREGVAPEILRAGDSVFHASGQPHRTRTLDQGMLAWVMWRNHLSVPPVWTERPVRGPDGA